MEILDPKSFVMENIALNGIRETYTLLYAFLIEKIRFKMYRGHDSRCRLDMK